jgi:hypothetical protein
VDSGGRGGALPVSRRDHPTVGQSSVTPATLASCRASLGPDLRNIATRFELEDGPGQGRSDVRNLGKEVTEVDAERAATALSVMLETRRSLASAMLSAGTTAAQLTHESCAQFNEAVEPRGRQIASSNSALANPRGRRVASVELSKRYNIH